MQSIREKEVRIFYSELVCVLGDQFEFLWYFSKKMSVCKCCGGKPEKDRPYRIFINGYGDFIIYNTCSHCDYPIQYYCELSQEPQINARVNRLWCSRHN